MFYCVFDNKNIFFYSYFRPAEDIYPRPQDGGFFKAPSALLEECNEKK